MDKQSYKNEFLGLKKKEPIVFILIGVLFEIYTFFVLSRSFIFNMMFFMLTFIAMIIGVIHIDYGVKGFYVRKVIFEDEYIKITKKMKESKFNWQDIDEVQSVELMSSKIRGYNRPKKPEIISNLRLQTKTEKISDVALESEFDPKEWNRLINNLKKACENKKIPFKYIPIEPYLKLENMKIRKQQFEERLKRM